MLSAYLPLLDGKPPPPPPHISHSLPITTSHHNSTHPQCSHPCSLCITSSRLLLSIFFHFPILPACPGPTPSHSFPLHQYIPTPPHSPPHFITPHSPHDGTIISNAHHTVHVEDGNFPFQFVGGRPNPS